MLSAPGNPTSQTPTPSRFKWTPDDNVKVANEVRRLRPEHPDIPLYRVVDLAQKNVVPKARRLKLDGSYGSTTIKRQTAFYTLIKELDTKQTSTPPPELPPVAAAPSAPDATAETPSTRTKVSWTEAEETIIAKAAAALRLNDLRKSLTEIVNLAIEAVIASGELPENRRRSIATLSMCGGVVSKVELQIAALLTAPPSAKEVIKEVPIYTRVVDDAIRAQVDDNTIELRRLSAMMEELMEVVLSMPSTRPAAAAPTSPLIVKPTKIPLKLGVYGLMGHQPGTIIANLAEHGIVLEDLYFCAVDREKTPSRPKPESDRVFICTKFISHKQTDTIMAFMPRERIGYINGGLTDATNTIREFVELWVSRQQPKVNGTAHVNGSH